MKFKKGDRVKIKDDILLHVTERTGVVEDRMTPDRVWVIWDNDERLNVSESYLEIEPQNIQTNLNLDGTIMHIHGKLYKLVEIK